MTTISSWRFSPFSLTFTFLLLSSLLYGCEPGEQTFQLGGYRYDTQYFEQWKLPKSLREISGLAATVDGRLFAHADERAVVHQIDYQSGKRLKSFSLSNRPQGAANSFARRAIKGDFEGIAVIADVVYLVTSQGTIYTSRLGQNRSAVAFEAHHTGLDRVCEIEGVSYHEDLHALLLACKTLYTEKLRGHVVVFRWSIDDETLVREPTIVISMTAISAKLSRIKDFNPSGISVSPRNGNLLFVAARQQAMLEVTMAGEVVRVSSLPMRAYHRQTEGIALFADGTLILADEGGNKRGRLGVYRATH